MNSLLIIRVLFILLLATSAWYLRPFDLSSQYAAGAGLAFGIAIVLFEIQVRKITLKRIFGAAFGSLLGIIGAYLISLPLSRAIPAPACGPSGVKNLRSVSPPQGSPTTETTSGRNKSHDTERRL